MPAVIVTTDLLAQQPIVQQVDVRTDLTVTVVDLLCGEPLVSGLQALRPGDVQDTVTVTDLIWLSPRVNGVRVSQSTDFVDTVTSVDLVAGQPILQEVTVGQLPSSPLLFYFTDIDQTGGVFTAFPGNENDFSLWNYLKSEGQDTLGQHEFAVSASVSLIWYVFEGAAQPTHWGQAVAFKDFTTELRHPTGPR